MPWSRDRSRCWNRYSHYVIVVVVVVVVVAAAAAAAVVIIVVVRVLGWVVAILVLVVVAVVNVFRVDIFGVATVQVNVFLKSGRCLDSSWLWNGFLHWHSVRSKSETFSG